MIEFCTVFGETGNNSVDRLNITNLEMSKTNKQIKVEVANELSGVIEKLALEQIKKSVGNANAILRTDEKYIKENKNVMIYKMPSDKLPTDLGPEIIGKATADDMLLGRSIRNEDIVSIKSINENSGRVTISGLVFDADEREIKTKTGKEMHIVKARMTKNSRTFSRR